MNKLKERLENGETIIGRGWDGEKPEEPEYYVYGLLKEIENGTYPYKMFYRYNQVHYYEHFEEIPLKQKLRKWDEWTDKERDKIREFIFCHTLKDNPDLGYIINLTIETATIPKKKVKVKSQSYCLRWLADNGYEYFKGFFVTPNKSPSDININILDTCGEEPNKEYTYSADWLEEVEG